MVWTRVVRRHMEGVGVVVEESLVVRVSVGMGGNDVRRGASEEARRTESGVE